MCHNQTAQSTWNVLKWKPHIFWDKPPTSCHSHPFKVRSLWGRYNLSRIKPRIRIHTEHMQRKWCSHPHPRGWRHTAINDDSKTVSHAKSPAPVAPVAPGSVQVLFPLLRLCLIQPLVGPSHPQWDSSPKICLDLFGSTRCLRHCCLFDTLSLPNGAQFTENHALRTCCNFSWARNLFGCNPTALAATGLSPCMVLVSQTDSTAAAQCFFMLWQFDQVFRSTQKSCADAIEIRAATTWRNVTHQNARGNAKLLTRTCNNLKQTLEKTFP